MAPSTAPLLIVLLAFALLVAACGGDAAAPETTASQSPPGLPITYTGADGVESTVADVSRIVSLSGEFSEIIWALGLGDNLAGVDLSSVYPPDEMRVIPKVGVEFRLLAEPILALEPTVVIGDLDAQPQSVIDQVRGSGVPVVIFPRFAGIDAPGEKIRAVAHILGVAGRGEALAAAVEEEIAGAVALAETAATRPRVAVVYIATPDTILMLGRSTIFDGVLDALGAEDVGPEAGAEGFVPFTAEAIVTAAPEAIITAERGFDAVGGLEGFLSLPGIAQTPAGQDGRIHVFEDLYLLGFGPRAGKVAMEMVLALHPDLASDG
jgi:iron complex transport system substrate-binding protein